MLSQYFPSEITPRFFKIYWHEEGSSAAMRCTRVPAHSFDEAKEGFLASKKQSLITIVAITQEGVRHRIAGLEKEGAPNA